MGLGYVTSAVGRGIFAGAIGTAAGLYNTKATLVHFAAVWSSEQVMLPALGVMPPLTEMEAQEIAIDALHHAVYSVALQG